MPEQDPDDIRIFFSEEKDEKNAQSELAIAYELRC